MPTRGALINSTITASRGGAAFFSSFTQDQNGTLDSISVWLFDGGSADDYRIALYAGGASDSDITGASLVWDSTLITAPPQAGQAWNTIAAGGETLTAGQRYWLVVEHGASVSCYTVATPNHGDLNLGTYQWAAAKGYLAGGFPATALAADAATSATQSLKAYITYSTGAAAPAITSIGGDDIVIHGESVAIVGTDLGDGNSTVVVSPADDIGNGSAVTQTVTAGNATQLTITANLSSWAEEQTLYLFVTAGNLTNSAGHAFARADETAPDPANLTLPSPTTDGGTIFLTLDEADGQVRWVATANGELPDETEVWAGQTEGGNAALDAGNFTATATGNVAIGNVTGLPAGTTYGLHAVHEDAAGNRGTVDRTTFTTAALPTITLSRPMHNGSALRASESGIQARVYDRGTGALVTTVTGLSTDGSGVLSAISSAALAYSTAYRVLLEFGGDPDDLALVRSATTSAAS